MGRDDPSWSLKDLPKALLFVVVRSKDTNTDLRDMVRRTWLSVKASGLQGKLDYRFFVDKANCCSEEQAKHNDLVILGA